MSDFVSIFNSPGAVFARVAKNGNWLAAFVAVIILSTLPTVFAIVSTGMELLTLQRYQHDPILAERVGGEAGIDREIDSSNERWPKILLVTRAAGSAAVALVLVAGALTLAVAYFEARPAFFTMLGTVCYAVFPFAFIGAVLSLILLAITSDASSLDLENLPALNLSRVLDRDTSSIAVYAMASEMDLLLGGEILLLTFGLTKVTALTYMQGLAICGSLWGVLVLWKAVWMMFI